MQTREMPSLHLGRESEGGGDKEKSVKEKSVLEGEFWEKVMDGKMKV
jgi:hypothetical protein